MIKVSLKARHYRFITYLLKEVVATDVFRILNEIKSKVPINSADDDVIEVDAKVAEVAFLYPILTNLSEGLAAEINREMDLLLRPQIEAGVESENAVEWLEVYNLISSSKAKKAEILQMYIDNGKEFLNQ